EFAILDIDCRKHARIDVRGDRRIAIWPDLQMIGHSNFEAGSARNAEVRHKPAGRAFRAFCNIEYRKKRNVDAKQLQPDALETDALAFRVVDDLRGGDRPARPLRASC